MLREWENISDLLLKSEKSHFEFSRESCKKSLTSFYLAATQSRSLTQIKFSRKSNSLNIKAIFIKITTKTIIIIFETTIIIIGTSFFFRKFIEIGGHDRPIAKTSPSKLYISYIEHIYHILNILNQFYGLNSNCQSGAKIFKETISRPRLRLLQQIWSWSNIKMEKLPLCRLTAAKKSSAVES